MRKSVLRTSVATLALGLTAVAQAVPVIDGSRDVDYGAVPLATQANSTGFGDNADPSVVTAGGSELDGGYATVANGNLYIFLAGNLETNFNHLNLFIDSNAGGQNRLQPVAGAGGLNRLADEGTGNGLTFDSAFTADRFIDINGGPGADSMNPTGNFFIDFVDLNAGTSRFVGQFSAAGAVIPTDGASGTPALAFAINNSNVAGVTGDQTTTSAAAAALVTTGIELSIPLADLGLDGDTLRIAALINGGGNGFVSNQTLGSLPAGTSNLGEPRNVNFNTFGGDQFFTVAVPEPASLAVLGLGAAALLRRRK